MRNQTCPLPTPRNCPNSPEHAFKQVTKMQSKHSSGNPRKKKKNLLETCNTRVSTTYDLRFVRTVECLGIRVALCTRPDVGSCIRMSGPVPPRQMEQTRTKSRCQRPWSGKAIDDNKVYLAAQLRGKLCRYRIGPHRSTDRLTSQLPRTMYVDKISTRLNSSRAENED